jgi:hypothetical protein
LYFRNPCWFAAAEYAMSMTVGANRTKKLDIAEMKFVYLVESTIAMVTWHPSSRGPSSQAEGPGGRVFPDGHRHLENV